MDSRIRENPERTFDLVLQVACPASENEDPTVLWKFPQDFGDQALNPLRPAQAVGHTHTSPSELAFVLALAGPPHPGPSVAHVS
ncbi:hypothetical protein SRHO_G00166870 [Serrasalmus rhombeus]